MGVRRKTPIPFPDCGRLMRKYRLQRGFTIRALAEMVDINEKHLSGLESGHQMPTIKTLYRISVKLNVPLEKLLVDMQPEEQNPDAKEQILNSLDSMTNEELELVYSFICKVIPLTRKFINAFLSNRRHSAEGSFAYHPSHYAYTYSRQSAYLSYRQAFLVKQFDELILCFFIQILKLSQAAAL